MTEADDELMATIRDRFKAAQDFERIHHERGASDLNFVTGEGQWDEEDRRLRESEGKPCLTFNAMPQFLRRVTAQIRALNPSINVIAADSAATKDVAEIYDGLIRHIEYVSDAPSVYEAAGESAAASSIGHFRILADYCDGDTFDQELRIERIYNPFSVFTDPMAKHPTRMDAKYRFVVEELTQDEFKAAFPKAQVQDFTSEHRNQLFLDWITGERVVVAEHYWIEEEDVTLGLMADGSVIRDPKPPLAPVKTRVMKEPKVKWAKVSGAEVLEGPVDVPGRYIPIVTVTGEEFHLGEELYRSSVIRYAKDAQLVYNMTQSSQVEVMMLQPRAPYLVTANQVAGLEEIWASANSENRAFLPYNPDEKAPPPMRVPPPVASQAFALMAQTASEDMKRTTGIYDASLGQRSNETSGKAIEARQQESEASNSVYADNLMKAVRHCGTILIGMIPHIYDTRRTVRILGQDGQEKMAVINDLMIENGEVKPVNDLTVGKYDVRLRVGPSYDTKRAEAAAGMVELARVVPQIAAVGADILVRSQDIPDADRLADRIAKTLPPGMAEDPEEMTPEQMQAKQQQMAQAQQAQQVQAQAQQIEFRKAQAEAVEAEADAEKAQAEAAKAKLEMAQITGQLDAAVKQAVAVQVQQALAGLIGMQQRPL